MRRAFAFLFVTSIAVPALAVQPNFRIYDDQFQLTPLQRMSSGLRLDAVPLSQLTTSAASSGTALEAASTWNFTPAGSLSGAHDTIGQAAPVSSAWTCYLPDTLNCGFGASDIDFLLVSDSVLDGRPTRDVSAVRYDPTTGILSGRATIQDEGQESVGSIQGEVRLCLGTDSGAPLVPVSVFPNVDGQRRYMAFGDPQWQSPVFSCFPGATIGAPCRAAGGTKAALDATAGQTEGRIRNRFVRAGTVTLPSGHVLDALMVESFTSYSGKDTNCFLNLLTLRQWRLAWVVPYYGSVITLTSDEDVQQLSSFTSAKNTFLGYGLLPPISIQVTDVTSSSVTVSWNPGNLGERGIGGYQVHWGAVSGRTQAPANHSAPIPAGTTSYTITGLSANQTIYVSVSTRRSYTDPVSGVTTAYESIKLPQVIGADTNGDGTLDTSYPPETSATTLGAGGCVPGDIYPDGVGNGSVTLADFALARRKVLGTVAVNSRDTTCGDVHPGAYACQPEGQPGRWCIAPNGLFQTGDAVVIRRRVLGTLLITCNNCPEVASAGGVDPRAPGDLTPRGATDGVLNINDVVFALRSSVGLETPTAEELTRADVAPADRSSGSAEPVGNGVIDVSDVVLLLRSSVGLETLRWPIHRVRVRITDPVSFVAYRIEVAGWPAWARPEDRAVTMTGCDDNSQSIIGDSWIVLCDAGSPYQGPIDVFDYQYRGIEDVDPASLRPVTTPGSTNVLDPSLANETDVTLALSVP